MTSEREDHHGDSQLTPDLLEYRERRRNEQYAALEATGVPFDDEGDVDEALRQLRKARSAVATRRKQGGPVKTRGYCSCRCHAPDSKKTHGKPCCKPAVVIVEPVRRVLKMQGLERWNEPKMIDHTTVFDRMEVARSQGLKDSCMNGTISVEIFGADDAILSRYERRDNMWIDYCRGVLTLTNREQSCSCGGKPSVVLHREYQYERTLGWHWSCDRCGSFAWSHVDPRKVEK